jgi:hypothetical protein
MVIAVRTCCLVNLAVESPKYVKFHAPQTAGVVLIWAINLIRLHMLMLGFPVSMINGVLIFHLHVAEISIIQSSKPLFFFVVFL